MNNEETYQDIAKRLSAMTEEEREMLTMTPAEKEFYLQFKKNNPGMEKDYYQAWIKLKRETYQKTGEIIY